MRGTIIDLLKKHKGEVVSGQAMSRECNVSRASICKHIGILRKKGFEIESIHGSGYKLITAPDLVDPIEMTKSLNTRVLGRKHKYFESTNSTNDEAKLLALKGAKEGLIVVSEEQVTGRGRIQRGWYSPYLSGIYCSLILKPPFPPNEAPKCTLMAAVAIVEAFHELGLVDAKIKWPNDILVNGKKIVGILTEMQATMEEIGFIVIGMGINVSNKEGSFPEELNDIATSFEIEGIKISKNKVLATVLNHIEQEYQYVCQEGFSRVLKKWREHNMMLGAEVKVVESNRTIIGFADDIDVDGNLIVTEHDGSVHRIVAGDVRVRKS